jgi:hypothetical protein
VKSNLYSIVKLEFFLQILSNTFFLTSISKQKQKRFYYNLLDYTYLWAKKVLFGPAGQVRSTPKNQVK